MNSIERLNEIIRDDQKLLYRSEVIRINGYSERSGMFILKCIRNGKEATIVKDNISKLESFLEVLIPFEDNLPVVTGDIELEPAPPARLMHNNRAIELLNKNEEAFRSLGQILLEDIQKVRQDPAYVPQAKQVANSAQTIVNLVKLQLEIIGKG